MRKMKDSGIEWIGEIPENWDKGRIKFTLENHSGGTWGSNEGEDEKDIICVRVADFDYSHLLVNFHDKMTVRSYPDRVIRESSIKNGDILLEKSGGGETTPVGRSVLFNNNEQMMCANFIEWLRPNEQYDSRFLNYWLAAAYINGYSKRDIKQTTGIQNLDITAFLSERIAAPGIDVQEAIAEYLDKKCAEIDALIASKEKTNELLKERRQSIIYEAVTKGLNPDAPMKDSGIEWIGMIPEEWIVCKIKHFVVDEDGVRIGPFGSALTNRLLENGEYYVYSQANLIAGDFSFTKHTVDEETFIDLKNYEVIANDICVSMMGTIGKCMVVPNGIKRGIMDSHLIKIRLKPYVNPKFFEYVYDKDNSGLCFIQMKRDSKGTIMDGLNSTIVKNLFFPLPSREVQDEIVEYLDRKCAEMDTLISANEETIQKLKEYRQSIIYEAVTGKIEI